MPQPVVLGIDFGGTKTALAVTDAHGTRLGSATVPTAAEQGAGATLARAVSAARGLLAEAAPGGEPAAVGVATIGIPGENGVELAPNIPGWSGLALGRELGAAFPGARVRLATDVKAAAGVEAQQGALRGCDPGLYLNLGTGLAVAIVAGGRVVSGSNGASGEIGYALRRPADVGLGPQERIPLEDVVSGKALFEQAARHLPPGATGAEDVFARAPHDPQVAAVLAAFLEELGFHLVNLALALDPRRIAVGGGLVRSWDALHAPLRRALDAALPFPPELVPAAHPYDAPLLGALALGLAAVGEPDPAEPDAVPEDSPEHARIP